MTLTNDQYQGLSILRHWYRKYQHQFIEISGIIGTGTWELVQTFIDHEEIDQREIAYLSYNQKQILELAYKKYHAYYINGIIYKYTRIVDFDSLPVINPMSREVEYEWKREVRKKIDPNYKLIVVFDSLLLSSQTISDLASFGIPVILIRDPMLLPAPDTHTFLKDPNVSLREVDERLLRDPITYFAYQTLTGTKLKYGTYNTVSIVPRKQMNLYNLRASEMNLVLSDLLMDKVNNIYREKILHHKDLITHPGERVIVAETNYGERLTNDDNKKVKLYLAKGMVGNIVRLNKHVQTTKFIPCEFRAEFYHESFDDIVLDHHFLDGVDTVSHQIIPDSVTKFKYAYALSPQMARFSHWDRVTLLLDNNEDVDEELHKRLLYTAISRARKALTIIL